MTVLIFIIVGVHLILKALSHVNKNMKTMGDMIIENQKYITELIEETPERTTTIQIRK